MGFLTAYGTNLLTGAIFCGFFFACATIHVSFTEEKEEILIVVLILNNNNRNANKCGKAHFKRVEPKHIFEMHCLLFLGWLSGLSKDTCH
jgi:hypothetical protein